MLHTHTDSLPLLFLFIAFVCCDSIRNENDLVFAQMICRHGDRNVFKLNDSDPLSSIEYWPEGWGELTNIGKQQNFALGSYLRMRYAKLIGDGKYSHEKIYIKATDFDRVLMSAQMTLAALFPPTDQQKWNGNLNWQPIPVHTESSNHDIILAPCDRFNYELFKYMNTSEYKLLFSERKSVIRSLEEHSGLKLKSLQDFSLLFDQLYIKQIKGYRLPLWADEAMKSGELKYLATYYLLISTRTTAMKKIKCGYLLKEILDRFKDKSQLLLSPDRSLWMYFAHDSTIANILDCIGLFDPHKPPYASCLFFELQKSGVENYVQLFYRNSTDTNIPAMNIPNCGSMCPLKKWYDLFEDILPTQNIDEECKLHNDEILPTFNNPEFKPTN